ncbi:hypothetical protein SASPL_126077 [Salvia splendens]|uniref:HVA22-like protein n=1 Tax=Salvia splendens TaxID=180675 RepID=A0A8X8ZQM2_SALSN|nr:hypothetical protein SASPL_126077 [Salvia splendens]
MNFLGSSISSDVGLRLLLCPLGSNIVVRTACCSVGVVLPVYSTFKAIESKDQDDQHKWLVYWAAYGSFTVAETFTDKLLYWCPFYYHLKFAFLVWLQLPSVEVGLSKINPVLFGFVKWALKLSLYGAVVIVGLVFRQYHILLMYTCVSIAMVADLYLHFGASVLYTNYLRAFLQKHQARLDQIVIFFRSEMVKFASKHETEIQVTRSILTKILLSGASNQMVKEILHPTQRQIGGPTPSQRVETPDLDLDSDSDSEVEG